jgi:hypothetical protein
MLLVLDPAKVPPDLGVARYRDEFLTVA